MDKKRSKPILIWMIVFFTLCLSKQAVFAQSERYVTIFYTTWANLTMQSSLYGTDVYNMSSTIYSTYPNFNWWGKPAYAATHGDGTIKNNYLMYLNNDPAQPNNSLIDYHADLLSQAGIDFITLDLTTGLNQPIIDGAKALCLRYQWRIANGYPTPKIAMWVLDEATLHAVETQIFSVYNSNIFFNYLNKKLLLVAQPNSALGPGDPMQPAVPVTGSFASYTSRHCWGLSAINGQYWSFKSSDLTPPPAFYYNGQPEQMGAAVATQSSYMTMDGINAYTGARGRQNGAFFNSYIEAAKTVQPKFLFIHSWNEWTAQNLGTQAVPYFTDLWRAEYSADIEPMDGGHADQYYQLMKTKIGEFKRAGSLNWEFTTDVEGWTATNQVTGLGWSTGGYLSGTIAGIDPYITSNDNLSINITNQKYLSIRLKNSSGMAGAQIYFITNADPVWNVAKFNQFVIQPNSDFTTYHIDMSAVAGWTGTLKQLRFDPAGGNPGTGTFQVDYMRISGQIWDFTSNSQGWTAGNNISGFGWQTGGYIGANITGSDANIYSGSNLNVNISANKNVRIRLKNTTSQTASQLYFITNTDGTWNDTKQIGFAVNPNSDFTDYCVDMSSVSGWTGSLKQLRIDPCNGSPGTGSFQIDYVIVNNTCFSGNTLMAQNSQTATKTPSVNPVQESCYPNPVNSTTTITYKLPASGYVSLKFFNLAGKELKDLVSKVQPAGEYQVVLDVTPYRNGIYFYKLSTQEGSKTRKIIVEK